MNKFMAILKDSFREAVDGWIFPVMLGLAGIIIVLVASSSVRPLAADVAVPRMIGGDGQGIQVRQDRGHGTKPAIFFVKLEVTAVVSSNSGSEPWAGPLTFNVTFKKTQQGRLVPAGVIFELGEDRIPKDSASLGELLIFGDPFKEAVRYWAGKTGEEKPKFTEELAKEFVAAMLADMGRMNGATATRQAPGGGLIEAAFGSADSTFAISVPGVDRVAWAHLPSLS